MNWIIRKSNKITCHTLLGEILLPILQDVKAYNWIIADVEYNDSQSKNLPINMDEDYFILTPEKFEIILNADVQIWWGTILGIPSMFNIKVEPDNPFSARNNMIWKDGNIQYPGAEIEIDCWDSSYTIVKFNSQHLSDKFRAYFTEAVELEKFK